MDYRNKYTILTRLPLLQGLSGHDLAQLDEMLKLEEERFPGMKIPLLKQGTPCTHLFFLTGGRLRRTFHSSDGKFCITAHIQSPAVIEPYKLYGKSYLLNSSYYADSDIRILTIRKYDVEKYLMKNQIFRLNYLNALSLNADRQSQLLSYPQQTDIQSKVIRFLRTHFSVGETDGVVHIKMTDLAQYLGETRINVSNHLNQMEETGIIRLGRAAIHIQDLQKIF